MRPIIATAPTLAALIVLAVFVYVIVPAVAAAVAGGIA